MTKKPVPPSIPEFRFVKPLGRGGMGTVWLAARREDGVPVAVKVLARLNSDTQRRMFQKEAVVCLNLDHENVVRGLAIGEADGLPWLAMEYVKGEDLQSLVGRRGPLDQDEALRVALEAARGLAEAARVGVVHRDVKPANLMLDEDGRVKVCDLGLVSPSGEGAPRVGTPLFMAPEQILGDGEVDHRADIYSLGLTLYFAATGEIAFAAKSPERIIESQLQVDLPDPREVRPELTSGFAKVVRKMTAKAPGDRYRLWAELVIDLEHLIRGESPLSAAISAVGKARARRRWLLPAVVGMVAVLLGLLIVANSGGPPPADPREAEARGQLDYVEDQLARRPDDLVAARAELLELAERFPGTVAEGRARDLVADLERRIALAEEREDNGVAALVEERLSRMDFDGALAAASQARWKLEGTDREPRMTALQSRIETRAREYLADLKAGIAPLLGKGDFAGVRTILADASRSAVGGISAWIDSALAEIDEEVRLLRETERALSRERYAKAVREALALARKGRWDDARAWIKASAEPESELDALDGQIVSAAERSLLTAEKGAAEFVGKEVAVIFEGAILVGRIVDVGRAPDGPVLLFEELTEPIALTSLDGPTLRSLSGPGADLDLAALALVRAERRRALHLLEDQKGVLADRIRELLPPKRTADEGGNRPPPRGGPAEADRLAAGGDWVAAFRIDPSIRERTGGRDPEGSRELATRGLDEYILGHISLSVNIFSRSVEADPFAGEPRLNRARALLDFARLNRSPILLRAIREDLDACALFRPDLKEADRLRAALDRIRPE